tara:strand:- start:978 stop:1121 length:144 start_codon:yes stop_codon:yes gene_type:complete
MVSGWDKSPGPDNHYTSGPVTGKEVIVMVLIFLIISGGVGYVFYPGS